MHLFDHDEPFLEVWLKVKKRAFDRMVKSKSVPYYFQVIEFPVKTLM